MEIWQSLHWEAELHILAPCQSLQGLCVVQHIVLHKELRLLLTLSKQTPTLPWKQNTNTMQLREQTGGLDFMEKEKIYCDFMAFYFYFQLLKRVDCKWNWSYVLDLNGKRLGTTTIEDVITNSLKDEKAVLNMKQSHHKKEKRTTTKQTKPHAKPNNKKNHKPKNKQTKAQKSPHKQQTWPAALHLFHITRKSRGFVH